jgi:AmmeMemoRadiSam system protein B
MLCFSAITPHPPIIIPGIGQESDLIQVKSTTQAMEDLRERFEEAQPDVIILSSPHAPTQPNAFAINSSPQLEGDLSMFRLDQNFSFENDEELAKKISSAAEAENIPTQFHEEPLDHGTLVPLWYLTKNIKPKLVSLAFSFADFQTHYHYGELIGELCRESDKKIAYIASGDMSHRLTPEAPAGFSIRGQEFDDTLLTLLEEGKVDELVNFDFSFVQEAGECGLRSFLMLLGVLKGKYEFNKLSYEGPFGVGYLVAELGVIASDS